MEEDDDDDYYDDGYYDADSEGDMPFLRDHPQRPSRASMARPQASQLCGTNGTCATQELGGITGAPHTGAPHTPHTGAPHTPTCTLYMCIYMCVSAYTFGFRHGPCEHGSRVPIGGVHADTN